MPTPRKSPQRRACLALISEDDLLVFADGYDSAIMAVTELADAPAVVYDVAGVIEILCIRDGMSREDAEEFFAYNIAGAYKGESSPIFVQKIRPGR